MKLTRTALVSGLLAAAACASARLAPVASTPLLRIVEPAPEKPLRETYPPSSLPAEPVRRAVFEQINKDRIAQNLAPVEWDEGASRVADVFCAAQVAEKTRGHYLRNGLPPYARTAFGGVLGYASENSASWSTTATSFPETPIELALSAHRSMVEETPPQNGHRRTILDPEATHVGVGWAMAGGRFQMAQEFLARGLERLALKAEMQGAVLRVTGAARPPLRLQFVTIAREPLPARLTREEASGRTSYRYPTAGEAYVPEGHTQLRVSGTVTVDRIHLGRDRDFSFTFAPEEPGLFTLVFWLSKMGDDKTKPGGSAVIRVEP